MHTFVGSSWDSRVDDQAMREARRLIPSTRNADTVSPGGDRDAVSPREASRVGATLALD